MDLELNNSDRPQSSLTEELTAELKAKKSSKFRKYIKNHKKGIIISTVLVVSLIAFGLGFYFLRYGKDKTTTPSLPSTNTAGTAAIKTYNILDGLAVDPSVADRHPLAIIVENQVDARPQSGLDKASIVYEAFAEGGITRFLALFSSLDAEKVGPVRSIRTYFVDWAHGVSAYLAHVGGNIDALDKIRAEKSYDLDQFAYSTPYWREYAAGLATEHTMYASTSKLWQQASKNSYPTANNFTTYKFKDDPTDADVTALPVSQKISINYLSSAYNVYFQYNKDSNSYRRFIAGKPQIDNISKSQISPKNLVIMTISRRAIKTRINEAGYVMTTVGSGKAQIFLDGKVIVGTWKKTSISDREIFYDEKGQEITFNRGQFWISVIPAESSVTIQ